MKHALFFTCFALSITLAACTTSPSTPEASMDSKGMPYCTPTQTHSCYERAQRALESEEFEQANLFLKRACARKNMEGCFELGRSYSQGRGVSQDEARAKELWSLACEGELAHACNDVGTLKLNSPDLNQRLEAKAHFRDACKGGVLLGCHNLAVLYDQGLAGQPNTAMANKIFKIACERGMAQSCHNLGVAHQRVDNIDAALICFKRGCKGGFVRSCEALKLVGNTDITTDSK